MSENFDRSKQQTFEQGRVRALEIALATFLRMQQDVPLGLFKEVLKENTDAWLDVTLDMTVTDQYREGIAFGAQQLQSLLPTKDL